MSVANQCVTLQHLYYNASWKNELTLASCSLVKHGLILISLGKHHQHTFKNYMHIQLSLSLHFCLLYLLLNNCNGNDAKQCSFLGRLLVAVKRAGASFILADVQSDVLSPSCIHMFFPLSNNFAEDILWYASSRVNEVLLQVVGVASFPLQLFKSK